MATCKGAWKLQEVRDQILAGEWVQYNNSEDGGQLWAWGKSSCGVLGTGASVYVCMSSPVQVPGTEWLKITTGGTSTNLQSLGRKTDGTLWAWGVGTYGRLGDNTIIKKSSPIQIPGTQWNDVRASYFHTLARKCIPT